MTTIYKNLNFSNEEVELMLNDNTAIKLIGFLQVKQKAIDIINKRIEEIEKSDDDNLKEILPNLKHGIWVLESGKARDINEGVKRIETTLKRFKRGDRPGFGLSRGFGEFIGSAYYTNWKNEWSDEIFNAIYKIEDYYNFM